MGPRPRAGERPRLHLCQGRFRLRGHGYRSTSKLSRAKRMGGTPSAGLTPSKVAELDTQQQIRRTLAKKCHELGGFLPVPAQEFSEQNVLGVERLQKDRSTAAAALLDDRARGGPRRHGCTGHPSRRQAEHADGRRGGAVRRERPLRAGGPGRYVRQVIADRGPRLLRQPRLELLASIQGARRRLAGTVRSTQPSCSVLDYRDIIPPLSLPPPPPPPTHSTHALRTPCISSSPCAFTSTCGSLSSRQWS